MMDDALLETASQEMAKVKKDLNRLNESFLKTMFFHMMYMHVTTPEKADKNRDMVAKYRTKKWKKVFEDANGDVDDAYDMYTKDAFFC